MDLSKHQDVKPCLNCGTALHMNFCPQCGQKAAVGRITFKETFRSFLSTAFAIEGPFFTTLRLLIVNPGKVFREYFSGKRKPYYQPIPFFILLTAIYIILRTLTDFDPLEGRMVEMEHEKIPEIARKSKAASRFMVNNINNIMFFLVFSIGLALKLFFRKQYNLAEYTIVGFYLTGMYIIFGIFSMFVSKFASVSLQHIQLLFLFILIFYSSYSLLQRRSVGAFLKYGLVSMLSVLFYMILGFGFSYLVISFSQA